MAPMVSPACGGPMNGRNPVLAHTVPLLMEARCSKLVNIIQGRGCDGRSREALP